MAKAIAIFTGGTTELRQAAIREDGKVFYRMKTRDIRFGYRWSAWRPTGETLGHNAAAATDRIQVGFAGLTRAKPNDAFLNNRALFNDKGEVRVRLP